MWELGLVPDIAHQWGANYKPNEPFTGMKWYRGLPGAGLFA